MKISSVNISFNDAIYQETGIHRNSVAMREVQVESAAGYKYSLQVVKKNLSNCETISIALKNSLGRVVEDIAVAFAGKQYCIDTGKSQDAIVLDDLAAGNDMMAMELTSQSADVKIKVQIELEKDRTIPQKRAKKNKEEILETEKKKKNDKL